MGLVKYLLALLLILIPATSLADPHNLTGCSSEEVASAVSEASDGDTITIPECSATWTSTVTIPGNKNLNIIGAGIDKTIITDNTGTNWNQSLFFFDSGDKAFRLSSMTINNTNSPCAAYINGRKDWRMDNIKFNGFAGGRAFYAISSRPGLVDKCIFYSSTGDVNISVAYGDGNTDWANDVTFGSADAIFVENNTFDFGKTHSDYAILDGWKGERYVFRYNDIKNGRQGHHDACGGIRSARAFEIYNNAWTWESGLSNTALASIRLRGGTGVIFNNTTSNAGNAFSGGGAYIVRNYRSETAGGGCTTTYGICNGTSAYDMNTNPNPASGINDGWACLDQIGRGKTTGTLGSGATQADDPTYAWNNTCTGNCGTNGADLAVQTGLGANNYVHIVEDRDFFNTTKSGYVAYTCPHPLADPSAQGACASGTAGTAGYTLTGGESDTTAPTVLSVYVNGATMTITFSEPITSADNAAFTLDPSGADVTVDCPAVATGATSMACTISRALVQSETAKYAYTDTKVIDAAENPLANIGTTDITGNLTPAEAPTSKLTVNKTGSGCTITSSPSGISLGGATASDDFDFNTNTAVTLSGYSENGWNAITYGGDCASNGTVTMSTGGKTCTATCTQVYLFP